MSGKAEMLAGAHWGDWMLSLQNEDLGTVCTVCELVCVLERLF